MQAPYTALACIYDDLMDVVAYDRWVEYLESLFDRYRIQPERILDLACGTGNVALRLARKNYRLTGVDRSSDMLSVARKKKGANKVDFFQGDMCSFSLTVPVDVAVCLYDSINYLLSVTELQKAFQQVRMALKKEGYFIFDFNTKARIRTMKEGIHLFEGPHYTCFWEDRIDRERARWQVKLNIFFREGGESYRRFLELHEEQGYTIKEMEAALKVAGLKPVEWLKAYAFNQAQEKNERVFGICIR